MIDDHKTLFPRGNSGAIGHAILVAPPNFPPRKKPFREMTFEEARAFVEAKNEASVK